MRPVPAYGNPNTAVRDAGCRWVGADQQPGGTQLEASMAWTVAWRCVPLAFPRNRHADDRLLSR